MRRLVLALSLSACASAPETYQQGAPVRPVPPLRPGHGIRPVGQPGALGATPPRSPGKRVLPSGEGPGVWATGGTVEIDPVFLGVTIPYGKAEYEQAPANQCFRAMRRAERELPEDAEAVRAASEKDRRCMVAHTYAMCMLHLMDAAEVAKNKHGLFHPEGFAGLEKAHKASRAWEKRECKGVKLSDELHEAWVRLSREAAESVTR